MEQSPSSHSRLPEPLKVLHLVASLDIGGLERVVWDLARLTDRSRFEPAVMCLDHAGTTAPRFESARIPLEVLNREGKSLWVSVLLLARRLRGLRLDVLHTHNMKAHLLGTLAAVLARTPAVVNTKHGHVFPKTLLASLVNRLAVGHCRRIVAVSSDTASRAIEVERLPSRKVVVIRNGVDLAAHTPPEMRAPGASTRVIHVARLSPEKDQGTLLHAARLVADQVPEFHLDVVGDGPVRGRLEAVVAELGLGAHVTLLGARDDVPDLLQRAGTFVLSSTVEGISMTLLEAMAAALPVVATNVGGNSEVVVEGETGFLVPPADPALLARALLALIRDPKRARQLGASGRRRVEESFDLRAVVRTYERLYCEILDRH